MSRLRIIALVSCALALAFAIPVAAYASSGKSSESKPHIAKALSATQGMHVVQAVAVEGSAAKPGYFRVLLSNGKVVTLPDALRKNTERALSKKPLSSHSGRIRPHLGDTKTGDCGSNTFRLNEKTDGYPVKRTIIVTVDYMGLQGIEYYFTGTVSGGAGTGYSPYTYDETPSNPPPPFYSLTRVVNSEEDYGYGYYEGDLAKSSWVQLSNYTYFCYSEGPSVEGNIP